VRITYFIVSIFCCFSLAAFAEAPEYKEVKTLSLKSEFNTVKDWHVTAWQAEGKHYPDDDPRFGDIPAKICFWNSENKVEERCTKITSALRNDTLVYSYQTVGELSVIHRPVSLIRFVAKYSGGAIGALNQISFWRYNKKLDSFEQEGLITLSEQGEYTSIEQGNLRGTLVTADANWQPDETHFSPHHFYIEAYKYTPNTGYIKVLGYLTHDKYPSLDDVEKIDVISHETPKIRKLLTAVQ
jgi:hypothetical protein